MLFVGRKVAWIGFAVLIIKDEIEERQRPKVIIASVTLILFPFLLFSLFLKFLHEYLKENGIFIVINRNDSDLIKAEAEIDQNRQTDTTKVKGTLSIIRGDCQFVVLSVLFFLLLPTTYFKDCS